LPDLASPAEAGFAKAGNRFPSPIGVEDKLFGIMLFFVPFWVNCDSIRRS